MSTKIYFWSNTSDCDKWLKYYIQLRIVSMQNYACSIPYAVSCVGYLLVDVRHEVYVREHLT